MKKKEWYNLSLKHANKACDVINVGIGIIIFCGLLGSIVYFVCGLPANGGYMLGATISLVISLLIIKNIFLAFWCRGNINVVDKILTDENDSNKQENN